MGEQVSQSFNQSCEGAHVYILSTTSNVGDKEVLFSMMDLRLRNMSGHNNGKVKEVVLHEKTEATLKRALTKLLDLMVKAQEMWQQKGVGISGNINSPKGDEELPRALTCIHSNR